MPVSIDGVYGKEEIANLFAHKYENLYNSCTYNSVEMMHLLNDLSCDIGVNRELSGHQIDVNDIIDIVA